MNRAWGGILARAGVDVKSGETLVHVHLRIGEGMSFCESFDNGTKKSEGQVPRFGVKVCVWFARLEGARASGESVEGGCHSEIPGSRGRQRRVLFFCNPQSVGCSCFSNCGSDIPFTK